MNLKKKILMTALAFAGTTILVSSYAMAKLPEKDCPNVLFILSYQCGKPALGCMHDEPVQTAVPFKKTQTQEVLQKVADWQIGHFNAKRKTQFWGNGALFVGMADWAELYQSQTQSEQYWEWLYKITSKIRFQMGDRMFHADDQTIGQVNVDLYEHYGRNERMLWPTQCRVDWIMANHRDTPIDFRKKTEATQDRWSWSDALYMAPPVFAKMYALTGDARYIEFMDQEYKATYDLLYDQKEHLFFRDSRFFDRQEANGAKVFWGRGNGWVVGGLVEILKCLPENDPYRPFYEQLLKELCTRLCSLQCEDGAWHASLLDPASYPAPETSATGFIVYAMAYGVNNGILKASKFTPVIVKGWKAMLAAVDKDGKLGYVQPVGCDPKAVSAEMTEVYGVGAFLAAGTEIWKMAK